MNQTPGILCLSHLGWDYVWQRPQHLLSRMARHYPVIYVCDPVLEPDAKAEPHLRLVAENERLSAWQPVFPERPEVFKRWRELYLGLVMDMLRQEGWVRTEEGRVLSTRPLIQWYYTPTPWYFLDHLPAHLIVYDVMDELASFKGASSDLRQREARLMAGADLVFAGGRSLYEARRDRHSRVHLFSSGVEVEHFAQAMSPALRTAEEIVELPRPVLGYYGVIDERMDLGLISELASRRPDWSLVLIGPVTKLSREQLPTAPNIHYLGAQGYTRLPSFLKGFDVCLMPFAINEATRFISPTKTLEYMAAYKPIVSTPVPDVVSNWSEVVRVAGDIREFEKAVEEALGETAAQRTIRAAQEEKLLREHSWDRIADAMHALIQAALPATVAGARANQGTYLEGAVQVSLEAHTANRLL